MLIIKSSWKSSFANINGNKKAISERGWVPYNRILLLHPEIRGGMTEEEKADATAHGYLAPRRIAAPTQNTPNMDARYLLDFSKFAVNLQDLNYSTGVSKHCAKSLIGFENYMVIKDELNTKKEKVSIIKETIENGKKLTAGLCYKTGTCRLGELHCRRRDKSKRHTKKLHTNR